jgi:1-aminocyclopropane-1-carboxylate deaminase
MYRGENKMVDLKEVNVDSIRLRSPGENSFDIDILRLDKIHPVISGNKWFKLKNYLADAIQNEYDSILTFGGAYSNHIVATAYAAKQSGLSVVGVIRGEKNDMLSETLKDASSFGMQLHFISREAYSGKEKDWQVAALLKQYGKCYVIPEGGAGNHGIEGSKEILQLANLSDYSHIVCAIGTGTMFLGVTKASFSNQQLVGIPVLKGFEPAVEKLLGQLSDADDKRRCTFFHDYHFGGYAKKSNELIAFMNAFYLNYGIPSDFVYTGKLFYAVTSLIEKNYFPVGSRILVIHSGGLQGNRSLWSGSLLF